MKALLLLAFGGPCSLMEVEPFLTRLFGGRRPSAEQLERVQERYRFIGGSSPLPEITKRQAEALEAKLNARGYSFKSYVGMRYGHPLIGETVREILQDKIEEAIAVPMAPFRSRASTGTYIEELNRVKEGLTEKIEVSFVVGWHLHPLFLEAVRERIEEGLMGFPPAEREEVHLIFTAHSLPKSIVKKDPYVKDFEASVRGVLERIGPIKSHVGFQSKGGGLEEWVGPDVESLLERLSREKVHNVLVVPIGFVSDNIEILYDIDVVYRKKAESLKMVLKRSPSLNLSERFIDALADAVEEHIKGFEKSRGQGFR